MVHGCLYIYKLYYSGTSSATKAAADALDELVRLKMEKQSRTSR